MGWLFSLLALVGLATPTPMPAPVAPPTPTPVPVATVAATPLPPLPPGWVWAETEQLGLVAVTGMVQVGARYQFRPFGSEAEAIRELGAGLATLSVYALQGGRLVFQGVFLAGSLVVMPGIVPDVIQGPVTYVWDGEMRTVNRQGRVLEVVRLVDAPALDQVEPCAHAEEKHGLDAVRGKMAIFNCGADDLQIYWSARRNTWMYVCPDTAFVQCAVMFVRNCPIPHNNCYPMATVHITLCTRVTEVLVPRDGYLGLNGTGAFGGGLWLLEKLEGGIGEVREGMTDEN